MIVGSEHTCASTRLPRFLAAVASIALSMGFLAILSYVLGFKILTGALPVDTIDQLDRGEQPELVRIGTAEMGASHS